MARHDFDRQLVTLALYVVTQFACVVVTPLCTCAQFIAYEGFDYKSGDGLVGKDAGSGWKDAWFAAEGEKGMVVSVSGLTFPQLVVGGGKYLQDGKDTRVFRRLDTQRSEVAGLVELGTGGKSFGKDGTTIWISFLIANTSYPKQSHGGMHLMDGVVIGPTYKKTQRIQLGRQNKGDHWKLVRTDQGGPAAGAWDGSVVSDRTVRLLVYRFDFKRGPEEAWMWVDPKPGAEPNDTVSDLHAPQVADFRFNAVNIGSGGATRFDFDELRIGTNFDAVAPKLSADE